MYQQTIDIRKFTCPTCNTTGQYKQEEHETYCKQCGLIISTSYPYVAGKKHNTLTEFLTEQKNQRRNQKWKNKTFQPMQHG